MAFAIDYTRARKRRPDLPEVPKPEGPGAPFEGLTPVTPVTPDTPVGERPSMFAGPSSTWVAPQQQIPWDRIIGEGMEKLLAELAKFQITPEGKDLQPGEYSLFGKAEQPTLTPEGYPLTAPHVPTEQDYANLTLPPIKAPSLPGVASEGMPLSAGLGQTTPLSPNLMTPEQAASAAAGVEQWDYAPTGNMALPLQPGGTLGPGGPPGYSLYGGTAPQLLGGFDSLSLPSQGTGPLYGSVDTSVLRPEDYSLTGDISTGGLGAEGGYSLYGGEAPAGFGEPLGGVGAGTAGAVNPLAVLGDVSAVIGAGLSAQDLADVLSGKKDPTVMGLGSDLNKIAELYNRMVTTTGADLPQVPTLKDLGTKAWDTISAPFQATPTAAAQYAPGALATSTAAFPEMAATTAALQPMAAQAGITPSTLASIESILGPASQAEITAGTAASLAPADLASLGAWAEGAGAAPVIAESFMEAAPIVESFMEAGTTGAGAGGSIAGIGSSLAAAIPLLFFASLLNPVPEGVPYSPTAQMGWQGPTGGEEELLTAIANASTPEALSQAITAYKVGARLAGQTQAPLQTTLTPSTAMTQRYGSPIIGLDPTVFPEAAQINQLITQQAQALGLSMTPGDVFAKITDPSGFSQRAFPMDPAFLDYLYS